MKLKKKFYNGINQIISNSDYTIISSAIKKDDYVKKYGKLQDDVYEIALSFILERAIFYLDDQTDSKKHLKIIIEERGKKEDNKLSNHFSKLKARGTGYVTPLRIQNYGCSISFNNKTDDVTGLQLADLVAYPIARNVLDPTRANPSFEILESKFYTKGKKRYGLKIFP